MRITFHIGKYTVTIVICETHRKKKNSRHSAKLTADLAAISRIH